MFAMGQEEGRIPSREIMILSILDLDNPVVTRDLFTMLRSLRLFGGELNHATVVIGVIGGYQDSLNASILLDLAELNVEVELLVEGSGAHFRTMNKLRAFSLFNPLRFSHVLWLDADVVILNDPSPFLLRHTMPGSIDCVPELYSYFRRYPTINTTSTFWNSALSAVEMAGSYELAPSGTCNTGVLLFDAVTLPLVADTIAQAMAEEAIPSIYQHDRFLDSLYLVYAINKASIAVNYMSYSINYMAFFIGEIGEIAPNIEQIFFAHFLWEPEFFCTLTDRGQRCECIHRNEKANNANILFTSLHAQIHINISVCHFLAGDYSYLPLAVPRKDADVVLRAAPDELHLEGMQTSCSEEAGDVAVDFVFGWHCRMIWPPKQWTERIANTQQILSFRVIVQCMSSTIENYPVSHDLQNISATLRIFSSHFNEVTDYPQALRFSRSVEKDIDDSTYYFSTESIDVHIDTSASQQTTASVSGLFYNHSVTATLRIAGYFVSEFPSTEHPQQAQVYCRPILETSSTVTLLVESHLVAPTARYAPNLLDSARTLQLASQLLLTEFISIIHPVTVNNGRRSPHSVWRGIVLCCDTMKGVQTVQRLLAHTAMPSDQQSPSFILVLLVNLPREYRKMFPTSVESLNSLIRSLFGDYCTSKTRLDNETGSSRKLKYNPLCKLVPLLDEITSRRVYMSQRVFALLGTLRAQSFNFIYLDATLDSPNIVHSGNNSSSVSSSAFSIYDTYVMLLIHSARLLVRQGGVLMGSRYDAPPVKLVGQGYVRLDDITETMADFVTERNLEDGVLDSVDDHRIESVELSPAVQVVAASIARAVQHFSGQQRFWSPFFTHDEARSPRYCRPLALSNHQQMHGRKRWQLDADYLFQECSPAWYFLRY